MEQLAMKEKKKVFFVSSLFSSKHGRMKLMHGKTTVLAALEYGCSSWNALDKTTTLSKLEKAQYHFFDTTRLTLAIRCRQNFGELTYKNRLKELDFSCLWERRLKAVFIR